MKQTKEFNNILNECLEQLLNKGETIEQCLRRYPEQAAELKPLLQTALAAQRAAAIPPRAEFKARARYQFQSALKEAPLKRGFSLAWLPRWATIATIAFIILLAGSGIVLAANNSLPGSFLYPVKLATEEVRLALSFSEIGKAELCAELANRRVAEIAYIAEKGDAQELEKLTQRLDEHLTTLADLVSAEKGEAPMLTMAPVPEEAGADRSYAETDDWAKLRTTLEQNALANQALLEAALETAPEEVKAALQHAIALSETDYQIVLEALE